MSTAAMSTTTQAERTCGRYHLVAQLGRGGMSEVYLAVGCGPAGFNKLLVLKELRADLVAEPAYVAMFLDEARLAARLNHSNIVQTNEVGQDGFRHFMAMEYLDGQPLASILRRAKPAGLPLSAVLRIAADVCAGLHYAHSLRDFDGTPMGLVHRDISPQNIFVTYEGQVKIVDFGIAKTVRRTAATQAGVLKGKIAYMSPEQMQEGDVDGRSDIFSLGVVLYEALTRQRMWGSSASDVEIVRRLMRGEMPSQPHQVAPEVPEVVDRICARALAPNRERRYLSALDMHGDLERCLALLRRANSGRELGEVVAKLFAKEREAIASVIDAQIRSLNAAPQAQVTSLPTIAVGGAQSLTPSGPEVPLEAAQEPTPVRVTRPRQGSLWVVFGLVMFVGAAVAFAVRHTLNQTYVRDPSRATPPSPLASLEPASQPSAQPGNMEAPPEAIAVAVGGAVQRAAASHDTPAVARPSD